MDCPKCGASLPGEAESCGQCGAPAPVYSAPEGFVYDPGSCLYYRIDYTPEGQAVAATWFDSVSGEYQQVVYESVQQETAAEAAAAPEAVQPEHEAAHGWELISESASEPGPESMPEGFVYDEASGLYYQDAIETDTQNGMPVRMVTWYSPQTRQYECTVYPAAEETVQQGGQQVIAAPAPKNTRRNKKLLIIGAAASVALLTAAGVLAWTMDWPPFAGLKSKAGLSAAGERPLAAADKEGAGEEKTGPEKAPGRQETENQAPNRQQQDDREPSDASGKAGAAETLSSEGPAYAEDWTINSLEELKEVLLKLKTQEAAGNLNLSSQQEAEMEESLKLFLSENPELIKEAEQLLLEAFAAKEERHTFSLWGEVPLSATASSTLPASTKYSYDAANVLDDSPDTAWVEGVRGSGVNEWIMVATTSGENALLSEISILNGYQRTDDTYYANGRIKDIQIEFSDGSLIHHTLPDSTDWQRVPLMQQVETSTIKIIIKSVYAGSTYEDTCIGEVLCH